MQTKDKMSIPELFMCPISLEILSDPVTLSTGQTYDRASIERWLSYGHRTCPVTMQRLHDTSLVANRTLKHLIDRWLLTAHPTAHAEPSDDLSLPTLRRNLYCPFTTNATKVETLRILRSLSPCLIQTVFCPLLIELLLQGSSDEVVELALDCVLRLPSMELASALDGVLKNSSNMSSFALLLSHGSVKVKTGLCRVLEVVALAAVESESRQELCLSLGKVDQVMRALASLVHDKGNATASEAALRALSGLCSSEANQATAVTEGAVDALVAYISGPSKSRRVCLALETLEVLFRLESGRQAMYRNPNAVPVLVKMVFRVPSDQGGSEHAVGSLLVACQESARVRVDAINAGLLTQLLLLLQSQCSGKAKANARALLKLLRAMWARDGTGW